MPFISKVAIGEIDCLNVFGNDYDTEDGTGVRDYIHIMDLMILLIFVVVIVIIFKFNITNGNTMSIQRNDF